MKKKSFKIWVVLLAVLTLIWIFVVPPLQTPDEQAHLRYIQFIAENKRLPNANDIKNNEILETSPSLVRLAEETQADKIFHNRNYHFDFENSQPSEIEKVNSAHIFNHPPLYYIWGAIIYLLFSSQELLLILYAVRISNLLFIALNFIFARKLADLLFKSKILKKVLPVVICFWPAFLFGNIGVNNDVMLFTSFFAVFYYLLKILKEEDVEKLDYLKLSLWSSIGLLSKAQFFVMLPVIVLTVGYKLYIKFNREKFVYFFTLLIFPLAYFIRNLVVLGTLFPAPSGSTGIVRDNFFEQTASCFGKSIFHYLKVLAYPRFVMVYKGFVGHFGWLDTQFPKWIYILVGLLFITGFVGAVIKFLKASKKTKLIKKYWMFGLTALLLEIFYSYLFLRSYLTRCYQNFPTQGRYYFPVILPLFLLAIWGMKSVIPLKFRKFLKLLVYLILFLNFFALAMLLQRYYL